MLLRNARNIGFLGGCVLALVLCAGSAMAQVLKVNFDENGNGTALLPNGLSVSLPNGLGTDPVDPTNGLKPLIYDLGGVVPAGTAVLPGDMNVIEPPTPTQERLSDLLRFTTVTSRSGPLPLLIVYSDIAEAGETPDLADVGIPSLRQSNVITREELGPENGINGVFNYTPTPNEPGFFPVSPTTGAGPTYNFTSDVPEPTALGLLGLGGSLCLLRRRR